ncbi:hypothetical protein D4764_04G0014600 [Takifugu flavidus]|uniref:Uncharacterized protein n=1 Tax=Takifugu flavidus TaxID=433684 RepID=A0A5C6N6P7_9TELE|nr:hypothetical protein D4764_04G0014600 [Takifugu flavidus]
MDIEHFQGCLSWCFRFMRRRHLSICARTTVAQRLPAGYQERVAIFCTYCRDKITAPSHIYEAAAGKAFTKVGINAEAEPVGESDSDDEEEEFGMLDIEIAQLFNSDTEDENFDGFVAQRKSKTYYLGLLQEKNQDIAAEISKLENHITKFSIDEADYLHVVEQNKTLAHDIKDLESQVADYHLLAGTPQYQTDANKLYIEYKRLKIKNDRETERNNNIFKKRARKKKRKK